MSERRHLQRDGDSSVYWIIHWRRNGRRERPYLGVIIEPGPEAQEVCLRCGQSTPVRLKVGLGDGRLCQSCDLARGQEEAAEAIRR